MRLVSLCLLLAGCATGPRSWRPDQHADLMAECRAACGGRPARYTSYDGTCACASEVPREALVPLVVKSYP